MSSSSLLRVVCRAFAVMLAAVLVDRATLLRPLIEPGASGMDVVILVAAWLAVLVMSVIAAWLVRQWLAAPVTLLVLMSTALLAIPLVPFVWRVIALERRPFVMLGMNALVFLVGAGLSLALWRRRRRAEIGSRPRNSSLPLDGHQGGRHDGPSR